MKKTLLLLFACLFGALGGVKAWTNQSPSAGNTYYLYHPGQNQFLFVGLDEKYGVTPSVFNATPIYVETGGSGDDKTTFSFVIRGTKYYLYQNGGIGSLRTDYGSQFEPKRSEGLGKYRLQTEKGSRGGRTTYKMLHAGTSGGQCSFEEYESRNESDGYEWQFISVSEMESARNAMAESCASSAASYATTSNGWERVTSVSDLHTNPENYFFAFFSANAAGLMLQATSNNEKSQKLYYKTAVNPASGSQYLFEMENHESGGFALKSCAIGKYFSNATSWDFHANQTSATSDNFTNLTLTLANGAYTIETAQATNYVGLWTLITSWYSTDKYLAGNKQSSLAGSFLIYRIPKQGLRNVDFTQCITNPSFETGNTNGWTVSDGGTSGQTGAKQTSSFAMSGSDGDWLFNIFWQGKPMTQNIGVLPAGQYTLSAVTTTDQGAKTYLTVNSGHNDGAISSGGASVGVTNTYNFTLAETTEVTIGVVGCGDNAEKTFDPNGYYWYKADNFRLTYLGGMEDLTPVSGKMKKSVADAQTAAVNAYNSNKTVENYFAAQEAIANAEASIAAYANAASYLEAVKQLLATTNFYTTAAYTTVYGTYKTAYDDGTMEDATARGLNYKTPSYTPAEARYEANTANDLLIPGWTIGGTAASTTTGFYINTWSTESEGSGDAADFANPFYEYWVSDGSLPATVLSGTLTGLTANKLYRVTANVRIQGTANSGKIKMQVGTGGEIDVTKGNQIGSTSRYIKDYVAVGKTDADGNLTLKFTVESESGISWLSFRDVMYAEQDDDFTYIIKNADCSSNTGWPGGGRELLEMTAYDGTTRTVFASNNYLDPETVTGQRSQTITIPATGAYKLTTYSKVLGTNNNGYVKIWIGDLGNYVDYIAARHLYTVNTSGNNTSTINSDGSGWVANDIYFTASASDLKTIYINISRGVGAGNNEYAYVSGMKLTYLGTTPEVSFDEAVVNPVVETNLAHANVTIARKMKSDRWNTFTVPFDMAIPDGWTVKELKGVSYDADAANYSMSFENAEEIKTGKAYMVKPGSDITEVNADDVTINTTTVTSSKVSDKGYTADFVGNNSYLTVVPWGSYIISNNVFYAVDTDIIQKGFRAYITVGGPSPSSARSTVSYDTEGGVTDIQNVFVKGLEESDALKDGKYLINGKIVIVKNGVKYGANGQKLN
jgi:hypothetical protein